MMNRFFIVFAFLVLVSLSGCGSETPAKTGDITASDTEYSDYTAYDVFTADDDAVYKPGDIISFQVIKSDETDIIAGKNIYGADIVCLKDGNGDFYAAVSDSEYYNCFFQIGDTEYPYSDTVEISEYSGVLEHSGFILSFGTGADHKNILYFYIEADMPVLLAECDKSNYEISSGDEGNRKLITSFGSMIPETAVYYNIDGQVYRFDMNSFIYDSFCADNEMVSVRYDSAEEKFLIDICSKADLAVVSSMEAYIDGDALYIR